MYWMRVFEYWLMKTEGRTPETKWMFSWLQLMLTYGLEGYPNFDKRLYTYRSI